jgi:hypothetical protein
MCRVLAKLAAGDAGLAVGVRQAIKGERWADAFRGRIAVIDPISFAGQAIGGAIGACEALEIAVRAFKSDRVFDFSISADAFFVVKRFWYSRSRALKAHLGLCITLKAIFSARGAESINVYIFSRRARAGSTGL